MLERSLVRSRTTGIESVTSSTSIQAASNPLRQLPSVFAMPALRRRLDRVLRHMPLGEDELVALLKLDPMAVVRGLRAANTVVFPQTDEQPTVRSIVKRLGPTLTRRLFVQPTNQIQDSTELEDLWRHAVATAHAASKLATNTGLLDPEVAYLLGLVHDLPEWLLRLERRDPESTCTNFQPIEWFVNWQLPSPFVSQVLPIDMSDRNTASEDSPDAAGLIRAAELLAELAGYNHPKSDHSICLEPTIRIDAGQMSVSMELEREVSGALRSFGFDPEISEAEIAADEEPAPEPTSDRRLDEIIVSILNCTRSESYRGIVTAVTAAAVRYGNYDRAFYAKWHRKSSTLMLRSKADSSSRRMRHTSVQVNAPECSSLVEAVETGTPIHLTVEDSSTNGLLSTLSTDELLAIPLNTEFETPAFLLLDRSLTLTPINATDDITLATMLGMTGSLLIENLLLRRRRQRAQKFALTDPLTRLFNRRMGMHALKQSIARTRRGSAPLTVLMCDLDHFKRLNDTLGHIRGDAALRATADVLRHSVRKSDTVCRYGGEEFLVVLPDTTPDQAALLAARMFTAVQARGESLGLPTTISIGLTCYRPEDTLESILIRADHALYASKGYGRNRFSADIDGDEIIETSDPAPPDGPGTPSEPDLPSSSPPGTA